MQKVYSNPPTLTLEINGRTIIGTVDKKFLRLVILDGASKVSIVIDSLKDVAMLRDFVRRAERLLKDSVRVQK